MILYLTIFIIVQNFIAMQVISEATVRKEVEYYTNMWAVQVIRGIGRVKKAATQLGFSSFEKMANGLPHIYLIRYSKQPSVMKLAANELTKKLLKIRQIKWAEQQVIAQGISPIELSEPADEQNDDQPSVSKDVELPSKPVEEIRECLIQNDLYWPKQYYLENCRDIRQKEEYPRDLNLTPVWTKHQLYGKNVKIVVVDEGIQTGHSDLADNYDPALGIDLINGNSTPDPVPSKRDKHSHGTRCAGVIAMAANNTICGVGVAPLVTLGAVRLLKGTRIPSDVERAKALLFKHMDVHISSNSWTYSDPGYKRWKETPLTNAALKTGITQGRGGKGLIYTFACGSNKWRGRNCSCDPLRASIYTILAASCDHQGKIIFFSEKCANIMVTTYSSFALPLGHGIVSTDVGENACTTKFSGTSASTPMVSGAIALALEANLNLTWRDIQHLLAWTCQVAPLQNNRRTWKKNGAGFYVSHDFGFGMLNINDLVEKAMSFQSVGPMNSCIVSANVNKNGLKFFTNLQIKITSDGCKGRSTEVINLEHVQVSLTVKYPKRGDLKILLISPAGTKAVLLSRRSFDSYEYGIENGTFDSVMTWGENPEGIWTVVIMGKKRKKIGTLLETNKMNKMASHDSAEYSDTGKLKELCLVFHGTSSKYKPLHYLEGPRPYYNFSLSENS